MRIVYTNTHSFYDVNTFVLLSYVVTKPILFSILLKFTIFNGDV